MAKVGFIGLGTMGASMAYNCLRGGNDIVVHDIRREAATRHLEAGAQWADTPREVAAASDVVFTSLPGPVEVEAVSLGEDGIMSGMEAGKTYFDLSTSSPTLIRQIHDRVAPQGINVLDAPVSGGPGRRLQWSFGDLGRRRQSRVRSAQGGPGFHRRCRLLRWANWKRRRGQAGAQLRRLHRSNRPGRGFYDGHQGGRRPAGAVAGGAQGRRRTAAACSRDWLNTS